MPASILLLARDQVGIYFFLSFELIVEPGEGGQRPDYRKRLHWDGRRNQSDFPLFDTIVVAIFNLCSSF